MARANRTITLALTLEPDERTRAALIALGWTPPEEEGDEKEEGTDRAACLHCRRLIRLRPPTIAESGSLKAPDLDQQGWADETTVTPFWCDVSAGGLHVPA